MKKVISLLLVCIMILGCAPVMAFAATWGSQTNFNESVTEDTNVTGIINVTTSLTVEQGKTLTIESGAAINIQGNATLKNFGTITVMDGGTLNITADGTGETGAALQNEATGIINIAEKATVFLGRSAEGYNKGTINNINRMTVSGILNHLITLPAPLTYQYRADETWNRTKMDVTFGVGFFFYREGDDDLAYRVENNYTPVDRKLSIWAQHGKEMFILITPDEVNGYWVDACRMDLAVGNQLVSSMDRVNNEKTGTSSSVYRIVPTSSLTIDFGSTEYNDIVKLFEIELPQKDGYYIETKEGYVNSVIVEFGKTLSFRVNVAEEYDKSNYYVYVNSCPMEANEYGYYDVTGPISDGGDMATVGGVQQDLTIRVMGIAPNDRIDLAYNIVSFVQEIFEVIKSIFDYFIDIFNLGGLFDGIGGNKA